MKVEGQTFINETVTLDGNEYLNCVFGKCRIAYGATAPAKLVNSEFDSCTWEFIGAAGLTVDFMTALYAMGGGALELIEGTFNNIRRGIKPQPPTTAH